MGQRIARTFCKHVEKNKKRITFVIEYKNAAVVACKGGRSSAVVWLLRRKQVGVCCMCLLDGESACRTSKAVNNSEIRAVCSSFIDESSEKGVKKHEFEI